MKLRVGVIGLGEVWQQRHAPALRMLADRFEVRAVCDQVAHRAQQAAAEFNAARGGRVSRPGPSRGPGRGLDPLPPVVWGAAHPGGLRRRQGGLLCRGHGPRAGRGRGGQAAGRGGGDRLHGGISPPPSPGDLAAEGVDRHPAGRALACCFAISAAWRTCRALPPQHRRPAAAGDPAPGRVGRLVPLRGGSRGPPGLWRDARRPVGPGRRKTTR